MTYCLNISQDSVKNIYCETTINYVISEWRAIGKYKKIIAIFLDFKRAFETIDREIILNKLYMYGIREIELDWSKSYMKGRRQTTILMT